MFADEVPVAYVAELRAAAQTRGGDLLVGLFFFEPRAPGEDEDHYFNSVVSVGTATTQVYRKRHLVPFGESIPAKPLVGWFIHRVLNIPLADQTPGAADQAPFEVAGQRVAVNICYEDAFGGELIRQLPEATLLVNVTNDAWYGRSLAAEQHEQIAAMRAIETARPMLRATNTGITSVIDHHGSRAGTAAVVHARRARSDDRRSQRNDAVRPLRRRIRGHGRVGGRGRSLRDRQTRGAAIRHSRWRGATILPLESTPSRPPPLP